MNTQPFNNQSTSSFAGKTLPLSLVFVFVLFGVGALGYYFGLESARSEADKVSTLINKEPLIGGVDAVDFEPFWRTWNVINERFVGSTTADQLKVYGAIAGLADSLNDPYTQFFPPVEKKEFEEEVKGQFGGVGMELGAKDGVLTVIAPLKGNPAERAGIKAGDMILKIDDQLTVGMGVDVAVRLIRGDQGTPVRLTLLRADTPESFDVELIRDVITVPAVETTNREDGVFVIRVFNFSGVVVSQFNQALRDFVLSKKKNLIIDLRQNPGGYLEASVEMASWFLPQGAIIVSEDRAGHGKGEVYRSKGYDAFGEDISIVVLIDNGSASASEIFAGALKDHGKATLIGLQTFGKGSVQELVPITKDTALKITIARWLTPGGLSITGNGIAPDFEVKLTKENLEKGYDAQMEAAAHFLVTGSIPPVTETTE